jgi:hypothetical protein
MRPALLAPLVALALAGCASNTGEIREVQRPAPPAPPRRLRFELIETASVATGSKVELWFPLASSEPGVQDIERLDVTITPDAPYEVSSDSRGNRVLHLSAAAPIAVRVTYRVLRTEVTLDLSREEHRELTAVERHLLAAELSPKEGSRAFSYRHLGPVRDVAGISCEGAPASWIEVFRAGLGWVFLQPFGMSYDYELQNVPGGVLIVAHGTDRATPLAKVDGGESEPQLTFKTRVLEEP